MENILITIPLYSLNRGNGNIEKNKKRKEQIGE